MKGVESLTQEEESIEILKEKLKSPKHENEDLKKKTQGNFMNNCRSMQTTVIKDSNLSLITMESAINTIVTNFKEKKKDPF